MLTFQRHVGNTAEPDYITDPKQIEGIALPLRPFILYIYIYSVLNASTLIHALNRDHTSPKH